MKCIHCGHTTVYKVRKENGGCCESCKHKFAFEPKDDTYTIGDPFFDRAIQNVSSENTLFFTPRQLWYEVERRLWRRRLGDVWGGYIFFAILGFIIGGIVAAISENVIPLLIGLAVAGLLVVAGGVARIVEGRRAPHPVMTYSPFRSSYLHKWASTHGEMEKLAPSNGQLRFAPPLTNASPLTNLNTAPYWELKKLPISPQIAQRIFEHRSKGQVFEKLEDLLEIPGIEESTVEALRFRVDLPSESAEQEKESPETPNDEQRQVSLIESESDLTEYSFDRALITDSAEIVDMLVANNFHFENNCAVLSVDGHPSDIFDTVLTMLRRNEKLTVFALHDASLDGCMLPFTLRGEHWFPDPSIRIIDLGLRPQHAQKMRVVTLKGNRTVVSQELSRMLAPKEVEWLERGFSAEVEVLRPERLMRAIYQGLARATLLGAQEPRADESEEEEVRDARRREATDSGFMYGYYFGSGGDYGGEADVYASDSFG